jgi:hypothetical protein
VDLLTDDIITLNVAEDVLSLPASSASDVAAAAAWPSSPAQLHQAHPPRPPHLLRSQGSGAGSAAAVPAAEPSVKPHLAQQLSWGRVFTSQQSVGSAAAMEAAEGAAALGPAAASALAAERPPVVARTWSTPDRAGPLPRTSSSRGSGGALRGGSGGSVGAMAGAGVGQQEQQQEGGSGSGGSTVDRRAWGPGSSGGYMASPGRSSTAAAPLPTLPTSVQTARSAHPPVTDFSDLVNGLR